MPPVLLPMEEHDSPCHGALSPKEAVPIVDGLEHLGMSLQNQEKQQKDLLLL